MTELKTWKQNLKHLTHEQYELLEQMCHLSKNVYNEAVYNIRQHYFSDGSYLNYEANYPLMKVSENYKRLGANVAQQTMKCADAAFKSFFGLMKLAKKGKYEGWRTKLPGYLDKDGLYKLSFAQAQINENNEFLVPMSYEIKKQTDVRIKIKMPSYLKDKKIHQIHIIPKYKGRFFEVRYMFEDDEVAKAEVDSSKFMGIDVGVNNLATCATSDGESFIIDGRRLKSANQWYNKQLSRLSGVKDKQGYIKRHTKKQYLITRHRNNRVNNYIYCAAKYIVNYCIDHRIGTVVVGYNNGFQENSHLGKVGNQNFVMIPFGRLRHRIEYLCNQHGIKYVETEESYTSKANFFQNDKMPVWNPQNPKQGNFTGKRVKRGLYKDYITGKLYNDDVMAALNIIRKSNLTALLSLQARGYVNEPTRILISS